MADRTSSDDARGNTTEIGTDGVARGVSNWTWGMAAVLAVIAIIGALLLGGFFSLGNQGQKINSENRGASRPAEP